MEGLSSLLFQSRWMQSSPDSETFHGYVPYMAIGDVDTRTLIWLLTVLHTELVVHGGFWYDTTGRLSQLNHPLLCAQHPLLIRCLFLSFESEELCRMTRLDDRA